MIDKRFFRQAMIDILDRESGWEHVALWYISAMNDTSVVYRRKDGLPKRINSAGRITLDLAIAYGDDGLARTAGEQP